VGSGCWEPASESPGQAERAPRAVRAQPLRHTLNGTATVPTFPWIIIEGRAAPVPSAILGTERSGRGSRSPPPLRRLPEVDEESRWGGCGGGRPDFRRARDSLGDRVSGPTKVGPTLGSDLPGTTEPTRSRHFERKPA